MQGVALVLPAQEELGLQGPPLACRIELLGAERCLGDLLADDHIHSGPGRPELLGHIPDHEEPAVPLYTPYQLQVDVVHLRKILYEGAWLPAPWVWWVHAEPNCLLFEQGFGSGGGSDGGAGSDAMGAGWEEHASGGGESAVAGGRDCCYNCCCCCCGWGPCCCWVSKRCCCCGDSGWGHC